LKTNIIPEDFEHLKVIGRGYFGKVTQVRFKKDGNIYALKTLKKSKLKEAKHIEHTKTERKILEVVHHPFIVSLKFAFQTEKKLYFVMDCYNGGELFYHLRSKSRFSEIQAKFYLSQILLAIEFLHTYKIIYRDLKPENIVLDANGYIKLTDFGLAKENITDDSGCTQTFCGTPEYLAPEIIRGDKYGKSVDVWCMGILLYEMLFGFVLYNLIYLFTLSHPSMIKIKINYTKR
jgi:serine/threonine protein kinase